MAFEYAKYAFVALLVVSLLVIFGVIKLLKKFVKDEKKFKSYSLVSIVLVFLLIGGLFLGMFAEVVGNLIYGAAIGLIFLLAFLIYKNIFEEKKRK